MFARSRPDAGGAKYYQPQADAEAILRRSGRRSERKLPKAASNSGETVEDIHLNIEARLAEIDRRCRRPPPHRPFAQRPGRNRPCAYGRASACERIDAALLGRSSALSSFRRNRTPKRHARLYPPPAGTAGRLRPLLPCLCGDVCARPRPLSGRPRATERITAWCSRACRYILPRSIVTNRRRRPLDLAADAQFARCGRKPPFCVRIPAAGAIARRICRGSPKKSYSGSRPPSASSR